MQTQDKLFIGGQWNSPSSKAVIEVISPHSEEAIARVPEAKEADIDAAVAAARRAFDQGPWPKMPAAERADCMAKLGAILSDRSEEIAETISREMGSPISFSNMGQAMAANMVLNYFTDLARTFPFEEARTGMMGPSVVRHEGVGVVAAIVPWNVPLFTIMLKLGPALAAGCTIVIKPAPETPLDAYILGEACIAAGIPEGVVSIVTAGREVGEYLVRHPDVDKVSFTGSTAAGRRIASICGEQLKRVTLELGGKSACILLEDADLDMAIPGLMGGAIMNNGQACVGQTRILAPRSRYDEVATKLAAAVGGMRVGDPMDPTTECGPLVSDRQRARVEGYIKIGRDEGATVAVGGGRPSAMSKGWYVEPTLFTGVTNQMRVAREEIFGPVLVLIPFDDEKDAVAIANDSDYGLAGSVWTTNVDTGLDVARRVRTGVYTVNGFMMEFGSPFGGFKSSGVGRELGPEGLRAYLESKQINLPWGYEPALKQ